MCIYIHTSMAPLRKKIKNKKIKNLFTVHRNKDPKRNWLFYELGALPLLSFAHKYNSSKLMRTVVSFLFFFFSLSFFSVASNHPAYREQTTKISLRKPFKNSKLDILFNWFDWGRESEIQPECLVCSVLLFEIIWMIISWTRKGKSILLTSQRQRQQEIKRKINESIVGMPNLKYWKRSVQFVVTQNFTSFICGWWRYDIVKSVSFEANPFRRWIFSPLPTLLE